MVKPDGVHRGLVGKIVSRFEDKGLKIIGMKMLKIGGILAREHYGEHEDKPFFNDLVDYITASPIVAMVLEGKDAVKTVRTLVGATNPLESAPGTIRGDYGLEVGRNVIHASDSPNSAEREINLFFSVDEIFEYSRIDESWLYE